MNFSSVQVTGYNVFRRTKRIMSTGFFPIAALARFVFSVVIVNICCAEDRKLSQLSFVFLNVI